MSTFFAGFTRERVDISGVGLNVVSGGKGDALVLLHGYPQTHVLWHKVAPRLAERFKVVLPDLRGYGDSDKPKAAPGDHIVYCKRTTADDVVALMARMGIERWHIVGHDRGARVAHRMALDHPRRVRSFTVLDVVPSQAAFEEMDAQLSYAWFHWHLMRQPYPLPETLIGNSARAYLDFLMERWCATEGAITPEAYAEYVRCFCKQETVDSTCAEYRSVELDLQHDEVDRRPQAGVPGAGPLGRQYEETAWLADRQAARHPRDLACTSTQRDRTSAGLRAFHSRGEARRAACRAPQIPCGGAVTERTKLTPADLLRRKLDRRKITMVSVYDYPIALLAERAGLDTLLVGDSLAMTALGHASTVTLTMEESLHHVRAVARAAKGAMVVADMPFLSYQSSERDAILNAGRFLKESAADAVKLEGGKSIAPILGAVHRAGIPAMGHIASRRRALRSSAA
jgi:haloacetate dehalogenase